MGKSFFLITSILLAVIVLLSGCGNKLELEEAGFVLVIGLDEPEDEENQGLDVTFQLADPQAGKPGSEAGGKEEQTTLTIRTPNMISAKDMANASETRDINFFHTKALVVSEELAKSEDFFPIISSVVRDPQIRRDMFLLISKERAEDYLRHNKPALESSPHKYYDFMVRRWENSALVPMATLQQFLRTTEGDADLALAIYTTSELNPEDKETNDEDNYFAGQLDKKGGTPIQMLGAAAFRNGKMVGKLTAEEVRTSAILSENKDPSQLIFTFPDPINEKYRITGKATNIQTNIKVDVSNPAPKITCDVGMEINVLASPSSIDYIEDLQLQETLDKHLEDRFKEIADEFIKRTQEELKAEPFGWSLEARKHFLTVPEFSEYDWMKSYPNADVDVTFKVHLENFGKHLRPRNYGEVRD